MNKDQASTLAGGGSGAALLLTVKWESIQHGELIKIGVAFVLMLLGYLMYKEK